MFSTPKDGWSTITINGWSDRVSYIQAVPTMMSDAIYKVMTSKTPQVVPFDAEGHEFMLILSVYATFVIVCDEAYEYHTEYFSNVGIMQIAKWFVEDIMRDRTAWNMWGFDEDISDRTAIAEQTYRIGYNVGCISSILQSWNLSCTLV